MCVKLCKGDSSRYDLYGYYESGLHKAHPDRTSLVVRSRCIFLTARFLVILNGKSLPRDAFVNKLLLIATVALMFALINSVVPELCLAHTSKISCMIVKSATVTKKSVALNIAASEVEKVDWRG